MNYFLLSLLILAFGVIEALIGGTRLVFSLPAYGILSLAALASAFTFRRSQVPANLVCVGASVLFFGYILARTVLSPVEYLARTDLYMVLGALIVYFFVALHLSAPKFRLWLILALLVIAQAHVFVGAIQFLRGENFTLFGLLPASTYGVRARGLYICPNHLAGYLEVVAMLGLGVACWSRCQLWLRLCAGYASFISLAGILLTISRGGYLSTFAGLAVFAGLSLFAMRYTMPDRFKQMALIVVLLAALLGVGVTYAATRNSAIQSRAAKAPGDKTDRFFLWEAALKQSQVQPWLGTGSGTFQYYGRQFRHPNLPADPVYVHNDYLHLYAEFGLAGAVTFLMFIGAHVWAGVKAFRWYVVKRSSGLGRATSDTLALNIGALSALATYVVHSVTDFNLHIPANALLLAVVFGILANSGATLPFAECKFSKTNRWLRLALPALGLWLLLAGVPKLPGEYFAEKARVAVRDDKLTNAVAVAEQGVKRDATNPYLHYYLGQARFTMAEATTNQADAKKLFAAAEGSFREGLKFYPQHNWLLLFMGWTLDALERCAAAEVHFKKAVEWDPNSMQVHAYYGTHLRLCKKYEEALVEFDKSLRLRWNHAANYGREAVLKELKELKDIREVKAKTE